MKGSGPARSDAKKRINARCSHCKSIRNDQGYWRSVESYIASRTEANFTHGICPECVKLHFPECYEDLFNGKED